MSLKRKRGPWKRSLSVCSLFHRAVSRSKRPVEFSSPVFYFMTLIFKMVS